MVRCSVNIEFTCENTKSSLFCKRIIRIARHLFLAISKYLRITKIANQWFIHTPTLLPWSETPLDLRFPLPVPHFSDTNSSFRRSERKPTTTTASSQKEKGQRSRWENEFRNKINTTNIRIINATEEAISKL